MVIKSQIFHILRKYLGEYLYGFTKDQLEIGFLSGEFELINVNFKPSKVNQMFLKKNLPFYLKSGMIGKLRIKCNYRSFLTSPIEVSLEELLIIVGPILVTNPDNLFERTETQQNEEDFNRVSSMTSAFLDRTNGTTGTINLNDESRPLTPGIRIQSLEKLQLKEGESILTKYLKNILTNLSVQISKVHIRFEDETYAYRHPYSITLLLDQFSASTSSNENYFNDSGEFAERPVNNLSGVFSGESCYYKQGILLGLSVFVTSMSSMLIPTSLWEETENSSIGIFSAFPAYEIRNLMIQEAENLKAGCQSQVLSHLTVRFSTAISTASPCVKVVAAVDELAVRVSDTAAECLRNLKDYVENARLWKEIRRYRPLQKIITESRSEDEPDYLKMLRREVAISWFQYCFTFLKAKFNKPLFPDLPSPEFVESPRVVEPESSNKSLFALKVNKVPGKASDDVKNLIRQYNSEVTSEQIDKIKQKVQPLMVRPENFFPKFVENSEFDVKTSKILIELYDDEIRSSCENLVNGLYLMVRVTHDELTAYLTVDSLKSQVRSSGKEINLFDMGQKADDKVKAVEVMATYRPGQHEYLIGSPPELNFIDVKGRLDEINLNYSHYILAEVLTIIESFKTDKLFMEILDEDYMKKIEQKRSTLTWKEQFVKKSRQVMHGAVFKKIMMAKKLIRRILQWQSQMKDRVKNVDNTFKPVLFDFKIETFGVRVNLLNKLFQESAIITLPAGVSEVVKDKDYTKIDLFGFGLYTKVPFKKLYKFFLKISENMKKGIKRMKNVTKRISIFSPSHPINRSSN